MKIIYLFVFCIFLLSCHESENNELLEFNKEYVNLGGGMCYKSIDAKSYLGEILSWRDSFPAVTRNSSGDTSDSITSGVWSEVINNDNSDIKIIIQKQPDNYKNCTAYYSFENVIVAQYNIEILEKKWCNRYKIYKC